MIFDFGIDEKKFNSYADLGLQMVLNVLQGKESLAILKGKDVQTLIKSIIVIAPSVELSFIDFDDYDNDNWFYVSLNGENGLGVEYAIATLKDGSKSWKSIDATIAYIDEECNMAAIKQIQAKSYYAVVIDKDSPIINKYSDKGNCLADILNVLRMEIPYDKYIDEYSV